MNMDEGAATHRLSAFQPKQINRWTQITVWKWQKVGKWKKQKDTQSEWRYHNGRNSIYIASLINESHLRPPFLLIVLPLGNYTNCT